MKKALILILTIVSLCSYGQTKINTAGSNSVANINTAISGSITASGTDTYTATVTNLTWASGDAMDITFTNANTGSSTFQLNGGTVYTLKKKSSGSLVNLASGDIINGDRFRFYNNGTYLIIEGGSGSGGTSGLVIGTTTITGGTTTRIPYNNAGVLGEYNISGSGSVAMTTSPVFTTPNLGVPSAADFSSGSFTWPTFNQNTTGSSGSVANALTVDNSSIQLNSGTTYDGGAARTISVKSLGITNAMLAGSIDLTSKVTGLLPDGNISSASTWNAKVSSQWVTTGSDIYYNTGNVMVGSTSAPSSKLHVVETSTSTPRGVLVDQYNTGTNGSRVTMRKARGSFASPTTIVTGDALASWTASGYDGTNFLESGKILVTSTGTVGTGNVPAKMELQTANASGVLTTGLTIDQSQNVTFSTAPNLSSLTASQILATDGSKNVQTLTTATYPSLTELSYVKGITSAAQTQLDSKSDKATAFNIQTGNYTLVLTDKDSKTILMRSTSAQSLTIPPNSSVAFPKGTRIVITQDSTGVTTVVAGAGVAIESSSLLLTSRCQDSPMVLEKKNDTDSWYLWNGLPAPTIDLTTNVTGILPVANGGTGVTSVSGTYTPTLFNTTNVAASTAHVTQWYRVGDMVTIFGEADIDPTTTATLTVLGISLFIPSSISNSFELSGTASNELGDAGRVSGDAANDRAYIRVTPVSVTNDRYSFQFSYQVL